MYWWLLSGFQSNDLDNSFVSDFQDCCNVRAIQMVAALPTGSRS